MIEAVLLRILRVDYRLANIRETKIVVLVRAKIAQLVDQPDGWHPDHIRNAIGIGQENIVVVQNLRREERYEPPAFLTDIVRQQGFLRPQNRRFDRLRARIQHRVGIRWDWPGPQRSQRLAAGIVFRRRSKDLLRSRSTEWSRAGTRSRSRGWRWRGSLRQSRHQNERPCSQEGKNTFHSLPPLTFKISCRKRHPCGNRAIVIGRIQPSTQFSLPDAIEKRLSPPESNARNKFIRKTFLAIT